MAYQPVAAPRHKPVGQPAIGRSDGRRGEILLIPPLLTVWQNDKHVPTRTAHLHTGEAHVGSTRFSRIVKMTFWHPCGWFADTQKAAQRHRQYKTQCLPQKSRKRWQMWQVFLYAFPSQIKEKPFISGGLIPHSIPFSRHFSEIPIPICWETFSAFSQTIFRSAERNPDFGREMRDKSNNPILNIKTRTSFSSILSILYHSPTWKK